MGILRAVRGGFLLAMGFVAFGGLLTSTRYAAVLRIAVVAAVLALVAALVIGLVRAIIAARRPRGLGIAVWSGLAGGMVAIGVLTRPGLTLIVVAVTTVVAVSTLFSQKSTV